MSRPESSQRSLLLLLASVTALKLVIATAALAVSVTFGTPPQLAHAQTVVDCRTGQVNE